jgi:hypothetical protein
VFVVESDDYSPQRSKALSIARAENVHLNSFTSLSTVLTAGVSTSSWHWKGTEYDVEGMEFRIEIDAASQFARAKA